MSEANNNDEAVSLTKRKASSGRVSYGNAVVLHETTQTKIVFIPFYINRSHGTELAIKLVTYKKAPPPNDWLEAEEKVLLNQRGNRSFKLMKFSSSIYYSIPSTKCKHS